MMPSHLVVQRTTQESLPEIAGIDDTLWHRSVLARLLRGEPVVVAPIRQRRYVDRATGLTVSLKTYMPDLEGDCCLRTTAGVLEIVQLDIAGYHYLNPRFTVSCQDLCAEFVKRARQCRREWCMSLKDRFGSGRRRRLARKAKPHERALMYTGVMVIDGVENDPCAHLMLPSTTNSTQDDQSTAGKL